jgi:polyhydroxybutyrate depolymerase
MRKKLIILFTVLISNVCFAGELTISFTHGGKNRSSLVYVPATYNEAIPTTLVLCLHGTTQTNTFFRDQINMYPIADTANFIVVIPQGLYDIVAGNTWNSGAGAAGYYPNSSVDDVGFLEALIDTMKQRYNIDAKNVFATGFSMGAFMCNRLACSGTQSIKAIAAVSGTIGSGITCNNPTRMPVLIIHGTADPVVSYTNNLYGMNPEDAVAAWVSSNATSSTPIVNAIPNTNGDSVNFTHHEYINASNDNDVEFYKATNGTHWWYNAPQDVNYSPTIWAFFRKHKFVYPTVISAQNLAEKKIIAVQYFNINGLKVPETLASGIYIKRIVYSNGSVAHTKILQ